MKVLAIGAHPDDIEIFMLGLILCYKDQGHQIHLAIATDGASGDVLGYSNLTNVRKNEAQKALNFIADPFFFNFPDGELIVSRDVVGKIKEYTQSISPDIILTHAPEDYHPDHRALSYIMKQAVGFKCPIIYADTLMGINFIPDFYIDITLHFDQKARAILKHESQNPSKFLEATKLLNRFRSAQCNAPTENYAEAYRHEKTFPFADIRELLPSSPGINSFYKSSSKSMV